MSAFDEFAKGDESIVAHRPPAADTHTPNDVQRIKSAFIRACGESVQTDHRLKTGDSADFKQFAREHSIRFEHFVSDGESQYGWIQAIRTESGHEICLCSKMFGSDDEAAREIQRLEDVDSSGRSALSHTNRIVTDGGEDRICVTLGCDNEPAEGGQCQECTDATPGGTTESESPDATAPIDAAAGATISLANPPAVETDASPDMGGFDSWMPWADWDRKQPTAERYSSAENPHSWSDPANWTDRETAREWGEMDPRLAGHGFILQDESEPYADEADPFFVIDFDKAVDPDTLRMHPVAAEIIERAGSYADISHSWTGGHIIAVGSLPDGVKTIDAELPHDDEFPDASIEVYDSKRFVAMTGRHIESTPEEPRECQGLLDELADEYATVSEAKPDAMTFEPESTRGEIADVETTSEMQDVLDAIRHTKPRDVRLRSTVTEERSDGSLSMDPHWAQSESGARLAQIEDGWVYRKGMRGLDALQVVALEERIIHDESDYPSGEDFWKAVEALRERGAHIPEYEGGGEADPVSALPIAQLDALSSHERRRVAKKRGVEWPSTDEARERLFQTVTEVMRNEDSRVVDAPTSLGKSHTIAATPWDSPQYEDVTGGRPVVHLSETKDARAESVKTAQQQGGGCFTLLGRGEACPVAGGRYDLGSCEGTDRSPITVDGESASDWIRQQCEGKGIPFSVVHTKLKNRMDQDRDLPCCADGERCRAIAQWEDLREGDHQLIEATHNFARVPSLRMHTNMAFDEEPDFAEDLSTDRVRRMISALLTEIDAPVTTWETFIGLCRTTAGGDAGAEADQLGRDLENPSIDTDWFFDDPDAHTLAPAIARAIFYAEDRGNGRWGSTTSHDPPRLDANASDDDGWNREWVRVVLNENNDVETVRCSPDLNLCRSVVGLDAHPSMPKWQVNTQPHIQKRAVLDPTERQLWRRYERGLRVVQVGDATRPYASGEYFNGDGTQAILEHLREEYGAGFRTCITASSVEQRTQELMREAGVADPETMHYGGEKSRNDFANEDIGLVNGSIDPGDDFVLNLLAELDLDAEPETAENDDGEEYRAHGRGFVGPDAETAAEILASVRENHVAQSAGRYARDPDDPDSTATVFVRTDAMPTAFADVQVPGVEWVFSEQQRKVVAAVRERERPATAREIAEATDVSQRHAQRTLKQLSENSSVDRFGGEGSHGADLYVDTGLPNSGVVSVSEETTTDPVRESNTWSVSISEPTASTHPTDQPNQPEQSDRNAWWLDDRPDRPAESGGG